MESMVDPAVPPHFVNDVVMDYDAFDDFPDEAGHLFEDPSMRGHFDIKTHLEDLANRHPEFADQLRYPAWSNEGRNKDNSWGRKRRGSEQGEGETSKPPPPPPESQQPPESGGEQAPARGRPKDNLRNTVPDMGQKQQQETEDKESRGQRSWSAPPDNRAQQQEKPRFVSKIEITPVNPDAPQAPTGDAAKPPMAPPKPQPQSQQQPSQGSQSQPKSNVRHIPIFVEGRDEPVLPKNVEPEFTQTQAPPQHFSRPPPQPHFPSAHQFQQHPPRKQTPPHFEHHTAAPSQPQPQPKPEPPPPPPPQQQQQQPEQPAVNPRDPLYKVSCVQKEVDDLKGQIETFSAPNRSDKQYILLDELLTRNLIKLDNVDTEGREEVRNARKNAIKSIQRCISVLENKVPTVGGNKEESPLGADPDSNAKNEPGNQTSTSKQESTTEAVANQMEVENQKSQETNPSDANSVPSFETKEVPSSENNEVHLGAPLENKTA